MSKEDSGSSQASWVGNIYEKFEAMCHEVDDIMGQENIKILENHVQSVGDNVIKFCSNVKDLIPSSFGAPVKYEAQSVNSGESNFDLKDGDGECCFVAKDKEFSQQMDVTGSAKNWPTCIQVIDDLHFEDKRENPPTKEPSRILTGLQLLQSECFSINQDYASRFEEEKGSSGTPEVIGPESPDNFFSDESYALFNEEKQSCFDSSASSLITEEFDSFTMKEEDLLSNISEFNFPDEDPCKMSTSSLLDNQDHKLVEKVSIAISASAREHSLGSECYTKEGTVQATIAHYSLRPEFLCKDKVVNYSIHENSQLSEFYLKGGGLCDSISLGIQPCLNQERVGSIAHKSTPNAKFQMTEPVVHDSVPMSYFDVTTDNVPYSLLASSVASSDCETSKVRLTSSIIYPLLDSSDHGDTELQFREGYTCDNMVAEIPSASTSSVASQSSDSYMCFETPRGDIGGMDSSLVSSRNLLMLTDVPRISHGEHGGHKVEHMDLPVKLELGESCVFVKTDCNHTVLSAVEKSWLHKKKIRSPYSTRKKLEKEYKQLSIWYCDIDAEFNDISQEKLVPPNHNKLLLSQDSKESEWELV